MRSTAGRTLAIGVGTAIVAIAATAAAARWLQPRQPAPTPVRFQIPLGEKETFTNMGRQQVAISRDGSRIAYVANVRLMVRTLADPTPRLISTGDPNFDSITNPVFSPDGQSIAYWSASQRAIKRIPVTGGTPLSVCPNDNPYGMSWVDDHLLIGRGQDGIVRVSQHSGPIEQIVRVNKGERAYGPQLLPDRDHVLFTLATTTGPAAWESALIVAQSLKTGTRTTIMKGASDGRYLSPGYLLYASGDTVFAAPFDPARLRTTGPGVAVLETVARAAVGATAATQYGVAETGTLAYVANATGTAAGSTEIARIDRDGRFERISTAFPAAYYLSPRISPDGRVLAIASEDERNADIWVCDLSGSTAPRRLTFGGHNRAPVWSADGTRVIFQSDREGDQAVFWQRADGAGAAERLTRADVSSSHLPQSASRDGKFLLVTVHSGDTVTVHVFSFADRTLIPFDDVKRTGYASADFSPDGTYIAYSGDNGTYVQPFPATGAKYFVMPGIHPFWSRDGRELFDSPRGAFASVSIARNPAFSFGTPHTITRAWLEPGPGAERNIDVMPDGQHFIGTIAATGTTTGLEHIDVVLDWFNDVRARVK